MSKSIAKVLACLLMGPFAGLPQAMAADHVKDIQADKMQYLKTHFSTAAISKSVLDDITRVDTTNTNFNKLVFTVTPHFTTSQSATTPPDYRMTLTYTSIGGPFINSTDEVTSNGVPTTETFALSYRGMLYLDTQTVALSARDAPQSNVVKNLKAFSPLAVANAGSGDFEWRFQIAPHIQIMNFKDTYFHCTYGAVYPASKIAAALQGNAQALDCELRNDNNIPTSHMTIAFLQYYGVGITLQKSSATSTIEFNVNDAHVE